MSFFLFSDFRFQEISWFYKVFWYVALPIEKYSRRTVFRETYTFHLASFFLSLRLIIKNLYQSFKNGI